MFTWNSSPHLMFSAASGESGSRSSVFMYTRFIYLSCVSIRHFFRCSLLGLFLLWKLFHSSGHPCHGTELFFSSHVFDLRQVKEG